MNKQPIFYFLLTCLVLVSPITSSQGETVNIPDVLTKVDKLYKVYIEGNERNAPPYWAKEFIKNHSETYKRFCESVVIYAPEGTSQEEIQKLYTEREPYNIQMDRSAISPEMLQNHFGYQQSYYLSLYEESVKASKESKGSNKKVEKKVAPLTIIGFSTPILDRKYENYQDKNFDEEQHLVIHIVSPVGLAFDNKLQADYRYYLNTGNQTIRKKRENQLQDHFRNNMRAIFQYTIEHGKTRIVMNKFGCDAFLGKYAKKDTFFKDYWFPRFQEVIEEYLPYLKKAKVVEISFVSRNKEEKDLKTLQKYLGTKGFAKSEVYGLLPTIIFDGTFFGKEESKEKKQKKLDEITFVSAGDPNTFFGNGHLQDPSVEGALGRISIGAFLTWTHTNPLLGNNITPIAQDPSKLTLKPIQPSIQDDKDKIKTNSSQVDKNQTVNKLTPSNSDAIQEQGKLIPNQTTTQPSQKNLPKESSIIDQKQGLKNIKNTIKNNIWAIALLIGLSLIVVIGYFVVKNDPKKNKNGSY